MKKGFSLVELLVALALFTMVIGLAAGGFTRALHTQREVASLISAQSNAALAIEQVARAMRTGYLFCHDLNGNSTCSGCTMAGSVATCSDINFYGADGTNIHYYLGQNALQESDNGGPGQPVTSGNVSVHSLSFVLFGTTEGDNWNPRLTMLMSVGPSSTDPAVSSSSLNLETTVSARAIDCTQTPTPSC